MVAQSAPAVEDEGTVLALQLLVVEEDMVQPEGVAQVGFVLGNHPLLPVDPPEIDTDILVRAQNVLEEGFVEILVLDIPADGTVGIGQAVGRDVGIAVGQVGIQSLVVILFRENTIGRVQVERRVEVLLVQPGDKAGRVGEERLVPAPAGPLGTVGIAGLAVAVPVHIDDEHIHGDVARADVVHNIPHVLLGIALIFRIPVAKDVERGQRHFTGNAGEIVQSPLVVVTVAHEIQVQRVGVFALGHPVHTPVGVFLEHQAQAAILAGLALVDYRPARPRQQTVLEPFAHIALGIVEGTGGTFQVIGVLFPGIPHLFGTIHLEGYLQVVVATVIVHRVGTQLVLQLQLVGRDIEVTVTLFLRETGYRQVAVDDHKRSPIFELFLFAVFDTNHFGSQHRETHVSRLDNGGLVGYRIVLCPASEREQKSGGT